MRRVSLGHWLVNSSQPKNISNASAHQPLGHLELLSVAQPHASVCVCVFVFAIVSVDSLSVECLNHMTVNHFKHVLLFSSCSDLSDIHCSVFLHCASKTVLLSQFARHDGPHAAEDTGSEVGPRADCGN